MSEHLRNPEGLTEDKLRVVLVGEDPTRAKNAVLFARDGYRMNLATEAQGLSATIHKGRTLVGTDQGQLLIVRSHILHVDTSARRGELLVTPVRGSLRQKFMLTIGRSENYGAFTMPKVNWVLVDYDDYIDLQYSNREQIPDPFIEAEAKLVPLLDRIPVEETRKLFSPQPGTIMDLGVTLRVRGEYA